MFKDLSAIKNCKIVGWQKCYNEHTFFANFKVLKTALHKECLVYVALKFPEKADCANAL